MASMLMANDLESDFLKREAAGGPLDRPQSLFELDVNAGVLGRTLH